MIFICVIGVWFGFAFADFKIEGFYRPEIRSLSFHLILLKQVAQYTDELKKIRKIELMFIVDHLKESRIFIDPCKKPPGIKALIRGIIKLISPKKKG